MLNTNGTCEWCAGRVRNGIKRHTIEQLTAVHDESCPGKRRVAK